LYCRLSINMAEQQQQQLSPAYLLRGPMIATGAVVSFATPYVIQLSPRTLLHLTIIVVSMLWFCWDVLKCVERQSRISIDKLLNSIVLDDILRMIYDPEDGLLACMVGGFMGGCTMYGLRLKEEDKTRLVQATLEIDYQQANSLLMTPGGCKAWLPEGMQQWLNHHHHHHHQQQSKSSQKSVKAIGGYYEEHNNIGEKDEREDEEVSSNGSIPASPLASEPFLKKPLNGESSMDGDHHHDATARGMPAASNKGYYASMPQRSFINNNPTDPVDEMVSILRRLVYSQAKPYIQSIPESLLETVGLSAATMLLGTHLLQYRRNIRRQKRYSTPLGLAGNLLLAGVASGAISTIVAKRMILQGDSFSTVCREMMTRSWLSIKDKALRKEQWQSYLAMVVLLILGRRQSSTTRR